MLSTTAVRHSYRCIRDGFKPQHKTPYILKYRNLEAMHVYFLADKLGSRLGEYSQSKIQI